MSDDDRPGITLTRDQLECWAGVSLTDEQVEELGECIPNSSIPEAIATIVSDALGITDFTDETWLKFDADDDEDPSHTATVERNDDEGYVVSWWHEDVGLVTDVNFDTLEDAHAWLEDAGYADYTA